MSMQGHLFGVVPFPAGGVIARAGGDFASELRTIEILEKEWRAHFAARMKQDATLTRQIVSFQANKEEPCYRWFKYKEGFSAQLAHRFLKPGAGPVLDPFAGSGTTLFAASELGLPATGIELLPIGQRIIAARLLIEREFSENDISILNEWISHKSWEKATCRLALPTLRITRGAYPEENLAALERFRACAASEAPNVRSILGFALLCVLELISYTRKDGQYLRWDHRSGRRHGEQTFNKGDIQSFAAAIVRKLREIIDDWTILHHGGLLEHARKNAPITVLAGSCLDELPKLPSGTFGTVVTSPPYCNRYDYTRTYALELAMLGVDEKALCQLRQTMLSCTVENRPKDLQAANPAWKKAVAAADDQDLLQHILQYLEKQKKAGLLNNQGIPRMVRGYFYEMACVLQELRRVVTTNATVVFVNDNVRYSGAVIPVDLILCAMAEDLGLSVQEILVLPTAKGNSSQQMGAHGREPLRKCAYVWKG